MRACVAIACSSPNRTYGICCAISIRLLKCVQARRCRLCLQHYFLKVRRNSVRGWEHGLTMTHINRARHAFLCFQPTPLHMRAPRRSSRALPNKSWLWMCKVETDRGWSHCQRRARRSTIPTAAAAATVEPITSLARGDFHARRQATLTGSV